MSYFIVLCWISDLVPTVPLDPSNKHECVLVVRLCVPWSLTLFLLSCVCHLWYRLQVTNAAQVCLRTRLIKFSLTHTNTSWTICCIPWHQVTTKPLRYDNACVQLGETCYVVHLEKWCWMSACMYRRQKSLGWKSFSRYQTWPSRVHLMAMAVSIYLSLL